jgi:hypothetical protein
MAFAGASTNGSASWAQLRGGERLQHAYRFKTFQPQRCGLISISVIVSASGSLHRLVRRHNHLEADSLSAENDLLFFPSLHELLIIISREFGHEFIPSGTDAGVAVSNIRKTSITVFGKLTRRLG